MALTLLGFSSRQIENRLRVMFPGKRVPPWSTLARWARSRPANRIAALRWFDVAQRAARIVEQRMDEIDASKTPLLELLEISSRAYDMYARSAEARRGFFDRAKRN